jgi:hypothetical protein
MPQRLISKLNYNKKGTTFAIYQKPHHLDKVCMAQSHHECAKLLIYGKAEAR